MAESTLFLSVFEVSPVASLLLETNAPYFTIINVNNIYLQSTGAKREDLVGKGLFEALPFNFYPKNDNAVAELQASLHTVINSDKPQRPTRLQYLLPETGFNENEVQYLDVEIIPVADDAGQLAALLFTSKDVTTEELAAQKVRVTKAKKTEQDGLLRHAEEISHFGTWEFNLQNNNLYWSAGVYAICGYTPDNYPLNFESAMAVIHPADREKAFAVMTDTMQNGTEYSMHKRFVTADGSIRYINSRARLVKDEQQKPWKLVGVFHDITEEVLTQQQLQESENRFEGLVQTLDGIFWEADAGSFDFTYISPQVQSILGYTAEEWLRTPGFWQSHIHPEDRASAVHYCHTETMAGKNHVFEYRMLTATGDAVWLRDIVSVISVDGQPSMLRGLMIDISKDKKKDEEIRRSRQAIQKILDQSLDIICTIDKTGRFVMVSEAAGKVWGYSAEELKGQAYIDLVFAADSERTVETAKLIMTGVDVTSFENRYVCKDGRLVQMVWSARWDAADELIYCVARDVTETKKAEREIAHLLYNTEESFLLLDKSLRIVSFNQQFFKLYQQLFGRNVQQGDHILDYAQPERKAAAQAIYDHVLKGKEEASYITIPLKNGAKKVFSLKYKPAFNEDGETIGAFVTARDITTEELAKEKLEASEQQYKYLFENNPAPMFIWDFATRQIIDCNEAALLKYQYSREEFLRLTILDIRPPEDIPLIEAVIQSDDLYNNNGQKLHRNIWRHLTKNGELMEVEISGHTLYYQGRKSALVIIQDITEQRKAERAIVLSEEKYRTLFNSSPMPKWIYELESYCILDVNETAVGKYGYSREEFLQMTIFDLRPAIEVQKVKDVHQNIHEKAGTIRFGVFTHRLKDGTLIRVDVTGYRFRYLERECMMVLCNDVTEQEMLIEKLQAREAALFESNLRYSYVTKATNDAIWDWNLETHTIERGEGFQPFYGYSAKELAHSEESWVTRIHPDDKERVVNGVHKTINSDANNWSDEYRCFKADGSLAYVTDRGFVIRNGEGKPVRMVGAMQDITRRREEEQQRRLLETVVNKTNDAILITKAEPLDEPYGPEIIYVNEAFCQMTGYTSEEVIGKTPRILQGPDSDKTVLRQLGNDLRKWKHCDVDILNYTKNGQPFWVNLSIAPIADANGWFTHWVSVQKDITERKLDELQKKLLADISSLFNRQLPLKSILPAVSGLLVSSSVYALSEIWLIASDRTEIHLFSKYILEKNKAFYNYSPSVLRFVKGQGIPGLVWEKQQAVVWPDFAGSEKLIREEVAIASGLKSIAGFPLYSRGEMIGVLVLGSASDWKPDEQQLVRLSAFADHLAGEIKRKQLEEDLHLLFENAPDILAIAGPAGRFLKVNPAFCHLMEYTEEELTSQPFRNFIHPDDLREVTTEYSETIGGVRQAQDFVNRYRTKSGEYKWISWNSSQIFGEEGLAFAYGRDITDKKELQRLLDNANEMARIGGWEVDVPNDIHFWSKITREIHEVDETFVPNLTTAIDFYREDIRAQVQQIVGDAIANGQAFDFEMPIITAKGNERWVRAIGQAEFKNGLCTRIYGSLQDIHQRKTAELAFQSLFKERNTILESIGDAFFAMDKNWIVSYWNKQAEILLQTKRHDIIGKKLTAVFADATKHLSIKKYQQAIETGESVTFEDYYASVNRWFEISAYPSANGLSVYFKDISIRKIAEEQISRSNERFEKVTEATNDAIWDYDVLKDRLFWGKGFTTLFGYDPEATDVSFIFLLSCIHPDDVLAIAEKIKGYMADVNSTNWHEEYRFKKADGTYAYVIDRAVFIRNEEGVVTRVVGAMTDISYRKEFEESLRSLNEVLNERARQLAVSNRELEQFAYIASHDLQEPLRMVTGFLTQIEKKYQRVLDEKGLQYIHFAVDGARRMRQIILDLLEFSRIGRVGYQPEEIDLNLLVDEIRLLYGKQIAEKHAAIESALLPIVWGHRSPLRQVFQNLLGNAIKYSRSGVAPVVKIDVKEIPGYWEFSVSDNGIGIEAEFFEKIFIIFQRLHPKDEYSGTGMGLAICKKIVENLGGRIWVQSTPGVGSSFYFTIAKSTR